jgi:hypothetical protein
MTKTKRRGAKSAANVVVESKKRKRKSTLQSKSRRKKTTPKDLVKENTDLQIRKDLELQEPVVVNINRVATETNSETPNYSVAAGNVGLWLG